MFLVFGLALILHGWLATYNWRSSFMPGHEFRQAQTAIIARYIDWQDNFSLRYETPIVGKPWVSVLLEVPVYQWSVVGLSRLTGWSHIQAARAISLSCFYLSLPAIYLLLGRLGLTRSRRLLGLALILTTPVYIFYSRAFLMDAMEFMCCAWFLLGFVRTMDTRRWSWLLLTVMAGVLAALIKSAMLAVWLLPAAGYGAWRWWGDVRAGEGWKRPLATLGWGLATVAPALVALRAWVAYTDPIKQQHDSAWIFTASALSLGNWGLLDGEALFARKTWTDLLGCWQQAIMPPWLIGVIVLAGLLLRSVRGRVLMMAGLFILVQCLFPLAYAYQDYYFYSCAVFLSVGLTWVLCGLLDTRWPRWIVSLAVAGVLAAQLDAYRRDYFEGQRQISDGGSTLTRVVRDLTPTDSVIVVGGEDWAAITPFYAERRALMIRNGLEHDQAYLRRAFAKLADEDVSVMILRGALRQNRVLIELAAQAFDFDSHPTFAHPEGDVYVRRLYRDWFRQRLQQRKQYADITVTEKSADEPSVSEPFVISPATGRTAFPLVSPAPCRGRFTYGWDLMEEAGERLLSCHPDADLWIPAPAAASRISWSFGMLPQAYEKSGPQTDGIVLTVTGEMPDGRNREIYRRVLDPVRTPADRGRQQAVIPYEPQPGEVLHFSTGPNHSHSYDWSYWARIEVR